MEKTIEQKAKAYDEAIEKLRNLYDNYDSISTLIDIKEELEHIFPELCESEDEKIRKEILEVAETVVLRDGTLYGKKYNCREWIAWLEKQVESKEYTFKSLPRLLDMIEPTSRAKAYCQKLIDTLAKEGYNADVKIVEEVLKGWNGEEVPMATMDEQKPILDFKAKDWYVSKVDGKIHNLYYNANKVELKFKVGDWIIDKQGITHQVKNVIENVTNHTFGYDLVGGGYFNEETEGVRLWTIEDAKDGDVLIDKSGSKECPFIFKETKPSDIKTDMLNPLAILGYCGIGGAGFTKGSGWGDTANCIYYPATKEQRDTLFAKMKEFGYEWDFEKKELMKIEDEEYNGEDYGIDSLFHAQRILEKTLGSVDGYETDDGILSHKCAITAVKKLYEQKSAAWSKEDERMFDYALDMIEWYSGKNGDKSKLVSDWLKSIKDRVQPKQEWSKEDKERYISCLQRLSTGNPEQPETINSKWFKEHVYPQKQWKPSYEQMDSLEYIIDNIQHLPYSCSVAKELLEQLKKIKGE